jgi:choline dehydrogenase
VLVSRLSESQGRSVLLLEAGPGYPDLERTPDAFKYGYAPTASEKGAPHTWFFVGSGSRGQPAPVPRGKATGGASAIYGQVFIHGVPEDYDQRAAWGNNEWSYLNILPFL